MRKAEAAARAELAGSGLTDLIPLNLTFYRLSDGPEEMKEESHVLYQRIY